MTSTEYALFDTAIGACAVAWNARGLVGVQLPEADAEASRRRLMRKHPGAVESAPGPEVHAVIDRITALLRGEKIDLSSTPLDMTGIGDFERRVYEVTLTIQPGDTLTYGEIARRVGEPGGAQAVGKAMGRNPWPIVVPCHRVLGADGKLVGFSANGGVETKRRMLLIEGAKAVEPDLFDL